VNKADARIIGLKNISCNQQT